MMENTFTLEPFKDLDHQMAYEAMFRYMYGFKYDVGPFDKRIGFHFDVYRVARYYEVDGLKDLAFNNLKNCVEEAWDADEFLKMLKKEQYHDGDRNLDDQCFQWLLKRACRLHINELTTRSKFPKILKRKKKLALYLTQSCWDSLKIYCCPSCDQLWKLDSSSSPHFCPNCAHFEENWEQFLI